MLRNNLVRLVGAVRGTMFGIALATAAWCATTVFADAPVAEFGETQLEACWADLEKGQVEASRALLDLAAHPKEAVPFLKRKMQRLTLDGERFGELLTALQSDKDDVWKPAFEELEYFDPRLSDELPNLMMRVTEPPARQRLVEVMSGRPAGSLAGKDVSIRKVGDDGYNFFDGRGSWWAEHRVERISADVGWGNVKRKWTRALRALVLLEHIGTEESLAIVKWMATGHPDAQPTRTARDSLKRIWELEKK